MLIHGLSSPGTPALISQFPSGSAVGDVAIDGNLVLLGTSDQGLVLADMTNPLQPVKVGRAVVPAYGFTSGPAITNGITLTNKVAYVGASMDDGKDLFAGGYRAVALVMDIDLSQPRNVMNYYPYFAKTISGTAGNPCDSAANASARPGGQQVHAVHDAAT